METHLLEFSGDKDIAFIGSKNTIAYGGDGIVMREFLGTYLSS